MLSARAIASVERSVTSTLPLRSTSPRSASPGAAVVSEGAGVVSEGAGVVSEGAGVVVIGSSPSPV